MGGGQSDPVFWKLPHLNGTGVAAWVRRVFLGRTGRTGGSHTGRGRVLGRELQAETCGHGVGLGGAGQVPEALNIRQRTGGSVLESK